MPKQDPENPLQHHWSKLEDLHYHFYLILYFQKMLVDGRKTKAFKHMSGFIPGRNPTMCRTHHQKKMKKVSQPYSIIARFYRQKYTERYLDDLHLGRELNYFIHKSYDAGIIDEQEKERLNNFVEMKLHQFVQKNMSIRKQDQLSFSQSKSPQFDNQIPSKKNLKQPDNNKTKKNASLDKTVRVSLQCSRSQFTKPGESKGSESFSSKLQLPSAIWEQNILKKNIKIPFTLNQFD